MTFLERVRIRASQQPRSDPFWSQPFTAAGETLSSAGIFSSILQHHLSLQHDLVWRGKHSPHRVPACSRAGDDNGGPGNGSPGHRSRSTRCFASLRISTAGPGTGSGDEEEEEGPVGGRAACSQHTCRVPRWVLLCKDSTAFLLRLCTSTFFLPHAKPAAPRSVWIWVPEGDAFDNSASQLAKLDSQPGQFLQSPIQLDSSNGEQGHSDALCTLKL